MEYQNLAPHVGVLVSLLGIFAGISAMLIWRMLVRMEKKVDKIGDWIVGSVTKCGECKEDLKEEFLSKKAFDDWKAEFLESFRLWQKGRDDPGGLWDIINRIRNKVGV